MSGQSFVVPPRSWAQIAGEASRVRQVLGLGEAASFPVMDVIEHILDRHLEGFYLDVGNRQEMEGAEGYTSPDGAFIMLRDDVYEDAWDGDGRARFTAAHELGHLILHTNIPLARAPLRGTVPPYRLAEPQANQFAAEILMPRKFVQPGDSAEDLMDRFAVSYEAASNRLRYIRKSGG